MYSSTPMEMPQGRIWRYFPNAGMLLLIAILALLVLPPVVYLVTTSFFTTGARGNFETFTFDNYLSLIGGSQFWTSLLNTMIYASGSVVFAMSLGVVMAWIVERTNTPGRGAIILVSIASLGMPGILHTICWVFVLGRAGPVNNLLMSTFDLSQPIFSVYSLAGMIIIEGLSWVPLAYLLMSSIMRSTDASLEEASLVSGGNLASTFRRVTLKLALPALLALALLIFIRSVESFEVPAIVGMPGGVSVLTAEIFEAARLEIPPNYGLAAAFAVILLVFVLGLLQWYRRLLRNAERFQTVTGKSFRPRVLDLGRWRYLTAAVLFVMVFIIILVPALMMIWISLVPFYDGINLAAISNFGLRNYRTVFGSDLFLSASIDTVMFGAGSALLVAIISLVCGWLIVRKRPGSWFLDQLGMMPIVFPGIVLGMAFLQIFLNTPFGLYGTVLSLIIASTVHYLPYGMRYGTAGAMQLPVRCLAGDHVPPGRAAAADADRYHDVAAGVPAVCQGDFAAGSSVRA